MHTLFSYIPAALDVALGPEDVISYYFENYHIGMIAAAVAVLVVAAAALLVIFTRKNDKARKNSKNDTPEQK